MRHLAILFGLLVASSVGCERATGPADPATPASLVLTRASDFQGRVTHVTRQCGSWPFGYGCQDNVWFARPPDTAADAGVVVGDSTPVFVGAQGSFYASTGSAITAGDMIQIWTDGSTTWGATQCPPGAPCYMATQIVIAR